MNQLADLSDGSSYGHLKHALAVSTLVAFLAAICLAAGPTDKANADTKGNVAICTYSWVGPYGKAGDTCAANIGGYLWAVQGQAYEHSACVSVINNKAEVSSSWVCTPGPNSYTQIKWFSEDGIWRRGVVRNNSTGSGAHVSGTENCITCG